MQRVGVDPNIHTSFNLQAVPCLTPNKHNEVLPGGGGSRWPIFRFNLHPDPQPSPAQWENGGLKTSCFFKEKLVCWRGVSPIRPNGVCNLISSHRTKRLLLILFLVTFCDLEMLLLLEKHYAPWKRTAKGPENWPSATIFRGQTCCFILSGEGIL